MKNIFITASLIVICSSCNLYNISSSYTYKTECFGTELDGSQTVKAWGTGRNRFDAVEQAKKNAVNDIIFKGINNGDQSCQMRPLIIEVQAREKYEDYFNVFFADEGKYLQFVSLKDERILQKIDRDWMKSRDGVSNGIMLRILRSDLKKQLMNDKIINN
ncbi:MAG: hypothetical protein P8I11_03900 [Bacteroidia bacterium]|nr:hypothetical protein [Bacteroidia bacterium]